MSQGSLFGSESTTSGGSAVAHIDGGSRGNPGPAAYGVHITRDAGEVVELKAALGTCTNNVAEYSALIAALRWAVAEGLASLHVRSDSLLLVQQMKGVYKVKHPGLQPLFQEAGGLVRQLGRVKFEHVRREYNKEADRLANEAMDAAAS